MIEIPESATIGKQASETLKGKRIAHVIESNSPHRFTFYNGDPAEYSNRLVGRTVLGAQGYGAFVDILMDADTRNPGSVTLCQLLTVSGFCFIIDYLTGFRRWSVNYVIPGLIMAAAVTIVLCILIRPVKYRAYTLYQLVIAVLGVLDVFLWIAGFSDIEWPVVAAAGVSWLCFAVTIVFSSRSTRSELRKRFHI